jgi:thiol-disulfide isomerase/thioredoxin
LSIASTGTATHDATETLVGGAPATVIHDQHIFNGETRLVGELGVASWLAIGAIVPVRVFETTIRYLDPSTSRPVAIENPEVHHRNETLVGPGDPWLLGRAATRTGPFTIGGRLGVALPLGRTEPDPFLLGDMGLPHEHSQFGSGTFEPLLGVDVATTLRGVRLDGFALTIQSLYANGHAYQAGDRYAGGIGAASAVGTERWRFRATLEAQHETAEQWHGVTQTDEGNIGRTDVLAGAEITWRATDDWHLGASLKAPIYTHVVGGQVDQSVFVGLSVGMQLHVFEGDEEHEHDHHGHDHEHADVTPGEWAGLDLQDATTDGSAVPLVPVPGKITVFDFWATWCKPCRVVDHELAEVARRHPNDIAVRKVNIVDADSPASKKYLGERTIPHLKVFGRDGTLLWEHSKPPLVLIGEVETLVTGAADRRPPPVAGARRVAIDVTDAGFVPEHVEIPHGQPVTLVFTRTSDKTCAVDVHFVLPDGSRIDEQLPLGTPVEIPIEVDRAGEITYACGMNMNHGTIDVK